MSRTGAPTSGFRHWGGFLLSGGTAFIVDAGITTGLTSLAEVNPLIARIIAILVAMVVAWLMHRRITFDMRTPPSLTEFARFAAVAWTANLLNFAIYAVILTLRPGTWPFAALVISTGVAMVVSYLGFRFGVFREYRPDPDD
jgi:putative flippase GtrA